MLKVFPRLALAILSSIILIPLSCNSPGKPSPSPQPTPTGKPGTTQSAQSPGATPSSKRYSAPPSMQIDVNKQYTAIMDTAKGRIVLDLFAKDVPVTVNNVVFLAREGFYDGTTFHRVIIDPPFMAQGGDPTGTGSGDPGYTFKDEFSSHKNLTGTLSMANSGANTNGSQFFITYSPQPHLDGRHSVFGQVVQGMEVLKKLTPRDPNQNPKFAGDTLIKVTIDEK